MSPFFFRSGAATHPDDVRMTLGEHLEELRSRIIRAMIGLLAGAILCYVFVDKVVAFLCLPMYEVLRSQGFEAKITYLNPPEMFLTDLKIAFIVGFIVSAPYSLTQIWGFIAAGLYPNERKWVSRFAPVSIALFFIGAGFLLTIVSPLLIRFLVSYRSELPDIGKVLPIASWLIPDVDLSIKTADPVELPAAADWPTLPAVTKEDPNDPPESAMWVNLESREVRVRYGETIYTIGKLKEIARRNVIEPTIRIGEYVMFVLHLAAAFGIGFQVPVVVAFLAMAGIATPTQMGALRRYVWFGMAVCSAVITPPDLTSMVFLLLPMVLLYEVGLFAGRILIRKQAAEG
jgi:sec-independent protein translocase protein TatC